MAARKPTRGEPNKRVARWLRILDISLCLFAGAVVLNLFRLLQNLQYFTDWMLELEERARGVYDLASSLKHVLVSLWFLLIAVLVRHRKKRRIGYLVMLCGLTGWFLPQVIVGKTVLPEIEIMHQIRILDRFWLAMYEVGVIWVCSAQLISGWVPHSLVARRAMWLVRRITEWTSPSVPESEDTMDPRRAMGKTEAVVLLPLGLACTLGVPLLILACSPKLVSELTLWRMIVTFCCGACMFWAGLKRMIAGRTAVPSRLPG